jgi:iron complex transport system substrate-binding protein
MHASNGSFTRREFVGAVLASACARKASSELRIVSLSPSTTETVAALGALANLVGRTRYCNYPAEAAAVPIVGGYVDANLEAILAQQPSLVVGARGPGIESVVRSLQTRGLATYFPETESVDGICTMVDGIGARIGKTPEAATLVSKIRAEIAMVTMSAKSAKRPRVLVLFGLDPIVAAGPLGFPNELLRLSGADNAIATGPAYPALSMEEVAHLDADIILDTVMGGASLQANTPGWKLVRAVREHKVVPLKDETLLRPGPRVAEGLRALARTLREIT